MSGYCYGTLPWLRQCVQAVQALPLAEPLAARIRGIKDLQRLKQLHQATIQVPSLEAFGRLLGGAE